MVTRHGHQETLPAVTVLPLLISRHPTVLMDWKRLQKLRRWPNQLWQKRLRNPHRRRHHQCPFPRFRSMISVPSFKNDVSHASFEALATN
jgi:hypothetical protein